MTTARRRPKRRGTDARTALRNVPILADIDDEQLERLATTVERRHVPANQWLFHAGEPADSIYIVDSGRFVAVAPEGHVFAEMASGDSIGDLGVIAGAARSAGVRALRDGVVWRIAAETFTDMLEATPLLQSAMLRAMARMLRQSRPAKTARRPRVIGVVSNGDTAAAPMVDAIATSLDSHGRTAVIAPPVETTSAVQEYDELVEAFSETPIARSEATIGSWWSPTEAPATCGGTTLARKATDSWSWWINGIRRMRSIRLLPNGQCT